MERMEAVKLQIEPRAHSKEPSLLKTNSHLGSFGFLLASLWLCCSSHCKSASYYHQKTQQTVRFHCLAGIQPSLTNSHQSKSSHRLTADGGVRVKESAKSWLGVFEMLALMVILLRKPSQAGGSGMDELPCPLTGLLKTHGPCLYCNLPYIYIPTRHWLHLGWQMSLWRNNWILCVWNLSAKILRLKAT